jgi:hypothetical protein
MREPRALEPCVIPARLFAACSPGKACAAREASSPPLHQSAQSTGPKRGEGGRRACAPSAAAPSSADSPLLTSRVELERVLNIVADVWLLEKCYARPMQA